MPLRRYKLFFGRIDLLLRLLLSLLRLRIELS